MNAVVVYESMYGNSRAVAEAVADALGAEAVAVHDAGDRPGNVDLLVVGGPTHVHGLSTVRSRQMAVSAADEDGAAMVEPHAAGLGLREWLRDLEHSDGAAAATFDTRLDRAPWMTGVASRGIARRLRRRGYEVLASESFLVDDSEGPLEEGELERASAWGAELARLHEGQARKTAEARS
ncbi:MAG TPA: hypothetical protein VKG82_03280 [Solirubrobacteraceae bacterium]|nr:hypothetical protein [Solirubrobacteraceae bacterium]